VLAWAFKIKITPVFSGELGFKDWMIKFREI